MNVKKMLRTAAAIALLCTLAMVCATHALAQDEDMDTQSVDSLGMDGGTGNGPADVMRSPDAESALEHLGISPTEALQLKDELSSGNVNPEDLQTLCARVAAKNMSPDELDKIGRAMGLGNGAIAKLEKCSEMGGGGMKAGSEAERALEERGTGSRWHKRYSESHEPLSRIERDFQQLDSPKPPDVPTPSHLRQFGYSLFASEMTTVAPVKNVPVGDDYVVGPGDTLNMIMWGRLNKTVTLKVQRDGTVLVPQIGPLEVSGLTFQQARKMLEGRVGQITGVRVDITMGRLRTIQVFVVGEVKEPGVYTISALSHASNALAAAGGVTRVGSLRDIQVKRNGQVVKVIDLYQILMHGNTGADVRLEPNDVVFVPVTGPVVGIVGDVKRPAIYELTSERPEGLNGVLQLAGGINAFGYAERIQVERIQNHQRRAVLDVGSDQLASQQFEIRDGDLIKVFPVLKQEQNSVVLKGNINRPGTYEWTPGMRVADLIRQGEGVADNTFVEYALIRRIETPARRVHFIPVDLQAVLTKSSSDANLVLRPRDEITIYSQAQMRDAAVVKISGEVRRPGQYALTPGMKVSDLIHLAGGPKADAYLKQGELARTQVIDGVKTRHSYVDVDIANALSGIDGADITLDRNDELLVRTAPGWHLPWTVLVKGRVLRPGPYTIREGERLDSVLIRCGGMLPDAYPPGAIFLRKSVKKVQQMRLDESRARLGSNLAQLELYGAQTRKVGSTVGSPAETAGAMKFLESVMQESKGVQAQGRVVIHLEPMPKFTHSSYDVVLENGDQLIIPRRPSSVNVLGQVFNPTAIVFDPQLTLGDYLRKAGGPTELADPQNIMVVRADGSSLTAQGYKENGKEGIFPLLPVVSGGFSSIHLQPGDTVYVPDRVLYVDKLEVAKDVATIVGQTALGLGTLALFATSL
jgi:protein involved in polysaccharide export with SLBB domain